MVISHLKRLLVRILRELLVELVNLRLAFEHLDLMPRTCCDQTCLFVSNREDLFTNLGKPASQGSVIFHFVVVCDSVRFLQNLVRNLVFNWWLVGRIERV